MAILYGVVTRTEFYQLIELGYDLDVVYDAGRYNSALVICVRAPISIAEALLPKKEPQVPTEELFAWVDGGSRGNPGQGYGSFIIEEAGQDPVTERFELGPEMTSPVAEWESMMMLVNYIEDHTTATKITIYTDHKNMVNQIDLDANWKVADHLRQYRDYVRNVIAVWRDSGCETTITWISGGAMKKKLGH
jgi:ribonuclease HI